MNAFRFRRHDVEFDVDLLPPERAYRPVPRAGFPLANDVSDAKFVTVNDPVGALRSRIQDELNRRPSSKANQFWPSAVEGAYQQLAQLEARLGTLSERSFTSLVAAVVLIVFLTAGGFCLFGSNQPAPMGRALDISHVSLTPQMADGMPVLLVNAIVENRAAVVQRLPDIRADLYLDGRLAASTLIAPPAEEIGSGQSRGVVAKLRHPGGKKPELKLSFATEGVPQG